MGGLGYENRFGIGINCSLVKAALAYSVLNIKCLIKHDVSETFNFPNVNAIAIFN